MILLIMGVTGSGKTTVGSLVATRLGWTFLDADDFHSPEYKAKMRQGIHLTEADRIPWIEAIHAELVRLAGKKRITVVACSALRSVVLSVERGPIRLVQMPELGPMWPWSCRLETS